MSFSSTNHQSKPSTSQGATKASEPATKRLRVPAGRTNKWQEYAKENEGLAESSTKRADITGYDPHGKAHQIHRDASTIDSDDSSDSTIPNPHEQAKRAKEEVRIIAINSNNKD